MQSLTASPASPAPAGRPASEPGAGAESVARPAAPVATAADLAEMRAWGRRVRRIKAGVGTSPAEVARAEVRRAVRTAPQAARAAVARYGARVERDYGVSRLRQLADMWVLQTRYAMQADIYYRFQLYLPERRPRWGAYMHPAIGNVLRYLFRARPSPLRDALTDKLPFAAWCAEQGFPAVGTLATIDAAADPAPPRVEWPDADLFSKPAFAWSGRGARRWRAVAPGRYAEDSGAGELGPPLDGAELAAALWQQSRDHNGPVVVQRLLRNHAELLPLTRGGLATVRLVTYQMPDAAAGVVAAILKLPRGESPVDNFAAGGLAAPVHLDSGVLGPAVAKSPAEAGKTYDAHPDTGAAIPGRVLPAWREAVRLGLAAHDAARAAGAVTPVVGWDIAITDGGPLFVEMNTIPGVSIVQMATGVPLGETPYVPCVLAHLRLATR